MKFGKQSNLNDSKICFNLLIPRISCINMFTRQTVKFQLVQSRIRINSTAKYCNLYKATSIVRCQL